MAWEVPDSRPKTRVFDKLTSAAVLFIISKKGRLKFLYFELAARSCGVGVYCLEDSPAYLYEHMEGCERMLLLGYTSLTEEQIEEGIATLTQAVKR
jgi:hypothetical protein